MENKTSEEIRASVGSIYSALLSKRSKEKEEKEELKRLAREAKEAEQEEKKEEEEEKLSKKEKRKKEIENWRNIVTSLTGDDLEYSSKKSKKKKYKKWIDDDIQNEIDTAKKKKIKKKNYHKEFEPELNMLKSLVAEQNRFTADLQKRFQNAAGPANKDAMFPNKSLVELAATIMSGRSNSLGMVREIGNLKKTMADLYMKQKKLDLDAAGSSGNIDTADLGLMGSAMASSMFGSAPAYTTPTQEVTTPMAAMDTPVQPVQPIQMAPEVHNTIVATPFDPDSWEGYDKADSSIAYENIPHEIYVEKNHETGDMRFVAKRTDTGEEIHLNSIPTVDPNKLAVDEQKMTVRGNFEEVYDLRIV